MAREPGATSAWARLGDASHPRAVAAAVACLLSLYFGLTLAFRDSIPLFAPADEAAHLHYAVFLHAEGRLPRPATREVPGAGGQPPLVYAIAAPLIGEEIDSAAAAAALLAAGRARYGDPEALPGRADGGDAPAALARAELAGLRILRSTGLVFGLLAVIFTFAAVWRASQDARLAFLAAGLLAFTPQFLFVSATFNNDAAAAAVGAALLWVFARSLEDPETGPLRRDYLALALVFALGLVTKLATLPVAVATLVALFAVDRRGVRARTIDLALVTAVLLGVAVPFLLWSAAHDSGSLGVEALLEALRTSPRPEDFGGRAHYWLSIYWDRTFETYWAGFGGLIDGVPRGLYLAFFALTWTGLLGFFAGRRPDLLDPLSSRILRVYLLAAFGAAALAHLALNALIVAPEGRTLFAAAPHLAFALALGWLRLLGSRRRILAVVLVLGATLLAIDLFSLRGVLLPALLARP